jgi:hypothetical protein
MPLSCQCASTSQSPLRSSRSLLVNERIELHGWDGTERTWYGPSELIPTGKGSGTLRLSALHSGFAGRVSGHGPHNGRIRFSALVQDNGEAGIAIVGSEHLADGLVQVVAVIPWTRLPKLRPDFAFEFVASLRLLGMIDPGSELPVLNYIESITEKRDGDCSHVFAVGRHLPLSDDIAIPLSCMVETVSVSILKWLTTRDLNV